MGDLFLGAPIKRKEDPRLLRGEGCYVSDVAVAGMLVAAVVRSAFPHARINGIDRRRALALPGVVAIYIAADLGSAQRPLPSFGQFPKPLIDKWRPLIRPAPVTTLATDRVRYVGEPIALVVAESRAIAEDACDLVDIDYEPLAAVNDVESALARGAPTLFDGWPDNTALHLNVTLGDAAAAFRTAAHVVGDRFDCQRYSGMPLEGRGILAIPDSSGQGLMVWSSHQMPHFHRALICEALGLPEFAVRVSQPDLGGGFGQKAGLYPEDVLIPFAANTLGRPVKWLEDKREQLMSSSHSREQRFDAEMAFDADGKIVALRYEVLLDAGAYLTFPVVLPYLGLCHLLGPYRVPAFAADMKSVLTNKTTNAPYRGAGRPETVFVLNRLMDRAATKLGLDAIEIRRRNFIRPEEMPYETGVLYRDGSPMALDSGDYPAALDKAVAAIDPAAFRKEQWAARAQGRYLGLGIACNVEAGGIGPVESARVKIDPSGKIAVFVGVTDTGQGVRTSFAQVCADILGVDPDQVVVTPGDTGGLAFSRGTYHSRAAVAAGNAVHLAANKVKKKLLVHAAHHLEAAVEDLEVVDGAVRVKGVSDLSITLARCAQLAAPETALPAGLAPGLDETDYFNIPRTVWGNAVHAAIVEVDPELGAVEIFRYVVVHDCGKILNSLILGGQVHGGVAAGIGGAMLEQLVYDRDGQILTTTLQDYLMPRAADVPYIEVIHMETPSPFNPLGVKGAGEGGVIAPPATLAAAVEDALAPFGAKISRTPLSPSVILAALRQANGKGH